MERHVSQPATEGLVDPADARSNCGVGVVMDLDDEGGHWVLSDGLELLENLEHRGTTGAEEATGDGAGVTVQTPHDFFAEEVDADLTPGEYAVGVLFLPNDDEARAELKDVVEDTFESEELDVLAWRSVPTDNADLGATALGSEPAVVQVFVESSAGDTDADFGRQLYEARSLLEDRVEDERPPGHERFYVVSLDPDDYYPDLTDERVETTFAMVHARFSTNTLGAWHLAHPYRRIIHNGEFNTIQGNINWMRARETDLATDAFDAEKVTPIIDDPEQSDTASVDNALELLLMEGRDLPHALRMLIPEAWRGEENAVSEDRRDWYDYHASVVEPWDGPAFVAATDGDRVGAVLDRNGLRPCRYDVLEDNTLVMASEAGALDTDPAEIEERGRLQPGQLFLADPKEGRVIPDDEVFEDLTDETYGEWVDREQVELADLVGAPDNLPADEYEALRAHQAMYGYTYDEVDHLIEPMAEKGKDPVGSMGDDTPLSVLSQFNRPLFTCYQRNLLDESPAHARQLVVDSPVLTDQETAAIRGLDGGEDELSTAVVDITYDPDERDLREAVEDARDAATTAATDHDILVLSDRDAGPEAVPIPSLLAVGGIHHHLVRNGLRNHVGLVLESGDPRTVHQLATLVGYGAGAVNPYLAYQTIEDLVAGPDGAELSTAIDAYINALEDGLLKTMAKMGISTVESYQGAQIFEAVGLSS
ncbi:glutamate synthase subunit alpha, partial [Halobacteriales archaeon QH_1_68_42]